MIGALATASSWLADTTAATGDDYGKAAPIGLAVIVALGIVCYFLAKSMNRNLKKVPVSFDPPAAGSTAGADDEAVIAAPTADVVASSTPEGGVVGPDPDAAPPPERS